MPFLDRTARRERWFKRTIVAGSVLILLGIFGGIPTGRDATIRLSKQAKWTAQRAMGIEPPRAEIEAEHHRQRLRDVERTQRRLARVLRNSPPAIDRFLRIVQMDTDSALIRWGNYDQSLAFSSAIFEADDNGRAYAMRPNTPAIWVVGLALDDVPANFLVPNTPEVVALAHAAGGKILPFSAQTTNSWGFRGPEPDLKAPVRGIVLGDSMMQGVFVLDHQTPPARLEHRLQQELDTPVSVLNTGVLGYSPEQYYYTLIEVVDRFRPQFVVVSVCANDFGDMNNPTNWAETEYWFDRIRAECDRRDLILLLVPAPLEHTLLDRSTQEVYPGKVAAAFKDGGRGYLDPIEVFTDEHLHQEAEALRRGLPLQTSPLYNTHLGDHHFSPRGNDLWAAAAVRRLLLVWEQRALHGSTVPEAIRARAERSIQTAQSDRPGPNSLRSADR